MEIVSDDGPREVVADEVAIEIRMSLAEHLARWGLSIENCKVGTTNGEWPVVVEVTTIRQGTQSFSFDREPYASDDPRAHANGAMNVIAALLGEQSGQSG